MGIVSLNYLFAAFKIVDCDLREILLNSFYNISVLGSIDQLKVLLDLEIIQLLCYQLAYRVMVEEDISKVSRIRIGFISHKVLFQLRREIKTEYFSIFVQFVVSVDSP